MKGTKPRRKIERLRVKIKGAGSANGDDKLHEGERKICKEEMKDNGEGRRKAQEIRRETKGAQSAEGK